MLQAKSKNSAPDRAADRFDFLVFIGRFQPFHMGHLQVVREGLNRAERLIVLIGSSHQPRNTRNPWTLEEREAMLRGALNDADNRRLIVQPVMDIPYNDGVWMRNVQATVNGLIAAHHSIPHRPARTGLIGHSKDSTSYYLKRFPQWSGIEVENFRSISATPMRESILTEGADFLGREPASATLPPNVRKELGKFVQTEVYRHMREELDFVRKYKAAWQAAPYEPTFVTVDAVVVQSGHILLVERKARPGKGLLALPGGFVNPHERLLDACIRELREETRLKVPEPVLRGSVGRSQVFDEPHRSARGRTITHAYHFDLEPQATLPKVRGSDDAKHAFWVPLGELDPRTMFEDHYFIIQEMVGL